MRKYNLLLGILLACCGLWQVQAQSVVLSLPDTTVAPGETVSVPIRTYGFTDIASMQFSLRWDTAVITYESSAAADLDDAALGDFQAERGEFRLSWLDFEDMPRTLPDGSVIAYLVFRAKGEEGESSPVSFSNTPLRTELHRKGANPGEFDEVPLDLQNGLITIAPPSAITVTETVSNISCFGAADGEISVNVVSSEAVVINWTGPDFSSTESTISDLSPGNYHLAITRPDGEMLYEKDIPLTEPAELAITDINARNADCASGRGSAEVIIAGGTAPFTYNLGSGPGGADLLKSLNPGNYTLQVTDANGCSASGTFSIEAAGNLPKPELGATRRLCTGQTATLDAGIFNTYAWSTGASTRTIQVSQPGNYRITVSDAFGCEATDEVQVQSGEDVRLQLEIDFLDICPGDSLELLVSGAENYAWIDTSGTLSSLDIANPVARPEVTAGYQVIGFSECGADTLSMEVFVYEVSAMAAPDTCIAPGTEAQLMAFGGLSYLWEDARFPVSDPTIPNPVASPEDSITYVVAITDFQGCTIRDSLVVLVANDPAELVKAINLITPNDDDKNDVLYFPNIDKFGQNSLKVFNRWGNTVYQKVNYQSDEERFDGTYNGLPLPAGTYYYLLSFRSGEIKQKLTILR